MIENKDLAQGLSYMVDAGTQTSLPRHYLGLSQLGHSCGRYLWFYFRWGQTISHSHRKMRIFQAGHDSEKIIVNNLRRSGFNVTNTQTELVHANGYMLGHIDGIIQEIPEYNKPVLLEAKSAKDAKWKSFEKNGVKRTYKEYYCQSQTYMNKLGLEKALFIVLNKDTSHLYYEIVDYNKVHAEALLMRGEDVIESPVPVKGLSTDPDYYECNWCEFEGICHKNESFEVSCRTCQHIRLNSGKWYCNIKKEDRTLKEQKEACEKYEMLIV